MLKRSLLLSTLPLLLHAYTMQDLFDGLKTDAATKLDLMSVKKAEVSRALVKAKLYPQVNIFAKYDNYNTPTGMVPVPPNQLLPMVQDPSVAQPFSENIYRAGAKFTMPIFSKSLYSMMDKAQLMQKSAKAKKRINLLKNEATIVSSNANLLYLEALQKALQAKKRSLKETDKTITLKVHSGRMAGAALYKIEDGLNQVTITQNNIKLQKEQLINRIRTLTGINLSHAIKMQAQRDIQRSNTLGALKPLKYKVKARKLDIKAQKEKRYPSLGAYGSYTYAKADAYNNDKNVHETYGNVGVALTMPLLSMDTNKAIQKSKVEALSDEVALQKLSEELHSKAIMIEQTLPLLESSITLYQKSIKNKKRLLSIAKTNYKSGRLSTEEYLRYEDEVVSSEAALYQARAKKWQTLMELAVIYADNIEEIIQ